MTSSRLRDAGESVEDSAPMQRSPWGWSGGITELAGGAAATGLGLITTAIVLAGPKASLLLDDGDSVLPLLWRASLRVGQPQEWILSSPLFLLELVMYGPAALLPLPNTATVALFAVIGWLALYVAARVLAAALGLPRRAAMLAALGTTLVPMIEALLEHSSNRNDLELAALFMTTTYYSGTVIASVLLLALMVLSARRSPRPLTWALVATVVLTTVATASNPIIAAWTIGPLIVVTVVLAAGGARHRVLLLNGAALAVGVALGMLARIPFSAILVQDNLAKVRPDLAGASFRYYTGLLDQRAHAFGGPVEIALALAMILAAVVALVLAVRRGSPAAIAVALFILLSVAVTAVASVVIGTFAVRYLQPAVLFPPLVVPVLWMLRTRSSAPVESARRPARIAAAVGAIAVFAVGAVVIVPTTSYVDPSVACATRWIDARGAAGAGQYWSVRAVKAAVADPRLLVQTDPTLHGYSWLTNADDFRTRRVYFTIGDAESPAFDVSRAPTRVIRCGTYTIDDYGSHPLEVGAAHH